MSEAFRWRASLNRKPSQARQFYLVLSSATLIRIFLNFVGIDPIRALYWSAVVNGVVAVPFMFMLMLMSLSVKKAVVNKFVLSRYLRAIDWVTTATMLLASLGLLASAMHARR